MPPSELARLLAVVVVGYCVVCGFIVSEGVCICLHGMDVRRGARLLGLLGQIPQVWTNYPRGRFLMGASVLGPLVSHS